MTDMTDLASELAYMAEHLELFSKDELAGKLVEASKAISKARTLRRYPGKKKSAASAHDD
jgi:hypothetical protein